MGDEFHREGLSRALDADEGRVYAIAGTAGHEPHAEPRLFCLNYT